MVLENIVVPDSWEEHPRRMLLIGFIYSTVGIFLAIWVFGKYASLSGIFLTTIPLVVVMYRAINDEEEKDMKICKEYLLMKEHMHILWFFIYLFIGLVFSFAFWFSVLPSDMVNNVFSTQIDTIKAIGGARTIGQAALSQQLPSDIVDLAALAQDRLRMIFMNNLRVWGFCLLFSLIYGAGAVFILTWNASVIGVAMGDVIRRGLERLAELGNNNIIANYFTVVPLSLAYLVHGIPEVASYFMGALAGGIISVAVVCHHYRSKEFWHIIKDSLDLAILSLLVLFCSAFIEVYITPLLV
jgi:hypothetical protein